MHRGIRLLVGLALLAALVALAWTPIQISRAIARCEGDATQCADSAEVLCAAGARGADALLEAAPSPQRAPEALRDLVFRHAACDPLATDAARADRVAPTLTGTGPEVDRRRARLDTFEDPVVYAVFAALQAQNVRLPREPAPPHGEALVRLREPWCAQVVPALQARLLRTPGAPPLPHMAGIGAMQALVAVDCGPRTDAALAAVINGIEAPLLAEQAELKAAHGGFSHAYRVAHNARLTARLDGVRLGTLLVQLAQRGEQAGQPWRWLKTVYETPLACEDAGRAVFHLQETLPLAGWTPADRAALAERLPALITACPQEHTALRFDQAFRHLPAHREALVKVIAETRPHCDFVENTWRTLSGIERPQPAAETTAAIAAYEADARARCPEALPAP